MFEDSVTIIERNGISLIRCSTMGGNFATK